MKCNTPPKGILGVSKPVSAVSDTASKLAKVKKLRGK